MKNTYSSHIFISGSFIGDTLLFFSTVSMLKDISSEIYFVTYHEDLIRALNPFKKIKIVDIGKCKNLLASQDKKIIISNHPGETIKNGVNLPAVISSYAKNYKFVDLYYRNDIFKKYKGVNYSEAMFKIVSRSLKHKSSYRPNQLIASLRKKLNKNSSDIAYMNAKYPFLSTKKYIVLIEVASMNTKKFNKWEQLIKKLREITNNRYQIIRISEAKLQSKKTDTGIHHMYCDLKYYPYIFLNKNCHLVISTDTGLAHLSAMLGVETFILYAISDPAFWNNGSHSYHSIIGKKNHEHTKEIQDNFARLDSPEIRGKGFITKKGFGVDLTTVEEITSCLQSKILH